MFKDTTISKKLMEDFKKHIQISGVSQKKCNINLRLKQNMYFVQTLLSGVDLSVQVLTTGFWPTHAPAICTIPLAPGNAFEVFRAFYLAKYSGRKLALHPVLGSAELSANFYGPQVKETP